MQCLCVSCSLPLIAPHEHLFHSFLHLSHALIILEQANLIMKGSSVERRRRQWHPTPVLLPGKSHGWRSLVGRSPWGHEESDTTEQLHFHFSLSCIGEGNGNPLQYSCMENPMDREACGLQSMGLQRVGHHWANNKTKIIMFLRICSENIRIQKGKGKVRKED